MEFVRLGHRLSDGSQGLLPVADREHETRSRNGRGLGACLTRRRARAQEGGEGDRGSVAYFIFFDVAMVAQTSSDLI